MRIRSTLWTSYIERTGKVLYTHEKHGEQHMYTGNMIFTNLHTLLCDNGLGYLLSTIFYGQKLMTRLHQLFKTTALQNPDVAWTYASCHRFFCAVPIGDCDQIVDLPNSFLARSNFFTDSS